MKRIDKILCGVGALTLFSLNPLESSAEVRLRMDGTGCTPVYSLGTSVVVRPGYGLEWNYGSGASRGASCPIPTGTEIVSLSAGADHEIGQVNARFHQNAAENVATYVFVHDYDSSDYCTCGSSTGSNSGYFQRSMPFNCGSCSYASNWAVNLDVWPYNPPGNNLTLKLVSVHDKD